eukprot:6190113-Pleurochrysis_carterae.AAC.1
MKDRARFCVKMTGQMCHHASTPLGRSGRRRPGFEQAGNEPDVDVKAGAIRVHARQWEMLGDVGRCWEMLGDVGRRCVTAGDDDSLRDGGLLPLPLLVEAAVKAVAAAAAIVSALSLRLLHCHRTVRRPPGRPRAGAALQYTLLTKREFAQVRVRHT